MTQSGESGKADIERVRSFFSPPMNERVTDEQVIAALAYFGRDSHKHMLAARSIVKSQQSGGTASGSS